MITLMLHAVQVLVPSILGVLAGWTATRWHGARRRESAMQDGMRILLRARLIDIHERYVEQGEACPVDAKEEADEAYHAYHALGGNGTGTHLHDEIMSAHIARPRQGAANNGKDG